jgi:hypothetical protein
MRKINGLWMAGILLACNPMTFNAQTNVTTTGTLTAGYPIFGDGTTTVLADPVTVDATLQAGADMCAKINASWTVLSGINSLGGTVDARGFTGTQTCAGSMWSNVPSNFAATLITGAVNIVTSVTQVRPTNTSWYSTGHATTTPYNNMGTSIQPSSSFTGTVIEQWGSSAVVDNIQDHNIRISCLEPGGSGTPISGGIGIQNKWAQEGSLLDNVIIDGCNSEGLDIETSNAQNSGPYNVEIAEDGVTSSSAVAIRVGNSSGSDLYPLRGITGTINGAGATTAISVAIAIDFASAIDLSDVHCEEYVTCVEIGANHVTHSVHITNLQCSSTTTYPMTTCVDISKAEGTNEGVIAENIFAAAGQNVTNVLVDNDTNGCSIPVTTDETVALYVRGGGNSVFAPGNTSCTNYITIPLVTP